MNRTTINRNGKPIDIEKDHNIYEVYYKGVNIGYFILDRLNEAIEQITNTGFYDGRNYDLRMNEIDERKA